MEPVLTVAEFKILRSYLRVFAMHNTEVERIRNVISPHPWTLRTLRPDVRHSCQEKGFSFLSSNHLGLFSNNVPMSLSPMKVNIGYIFLVYGISRALGWARGVSVERDYAGSYQWFRKVKILHRLSWKGFLVTHFVLLSVLVYEFVFCFLLCLRIRFLLFQSSKNNMHSIEFFIYSINVT